MEKRLETSNQDLGFGRREPRDMEAICMALCTSNGKDIET